MKKKQEFRPTQLVEPVQSCAVDVDGVSYVFNPGHSRLRGDHPAVLSNPYLFRALEPDEDEKPESA